MTREAFSISANYHWECFLLLNSGDDVEFSISSEALNAIYNDSQK